MSWNPLEHVNLQVHEFTTWLIHLCALSGSASEQWDERCRCQTTAGPPPCAATSRFAAARAAAGVGGCPPLARSACPWAGRRRCGCRRSRQRRCGHLDGLLSPPEGKPLWWFWGSLLPSGWFPRWMRTPEWTEISLHTTNHRENAMLLSERVDCFIMLRKW